MCERRNEAEQRGEYGGLAIVGKAGLELLAGCEDAALYSAEGQAGLFGYLLILIAGDVH